MRERLSIAPIESLFFSIELHRTRKKNSMEKMTSRQRVQATLNHQSPDRLPVDLLGTAGCLTDPAYFKLRDFLGLA